MDPSDEELRILRAAMAGSLRLNKHWRYVIDGDRRPERKARERLQRHDLIEISDGFASMRVLATEKGREVAVHGST